MAEEPQQATAIATKWLFSPEAARTIPYWFFGVVGLIYASGFVAVELRLETYGLRDIGAELWKARYIHVGVLCSVFPILPILTAGLLIKTAQERQRKDERPFFWLRITTGLLLYLIPQMSFYVLILLGRKSEPNDPHYAGFDFLSYILLTSLVAGVPIVFIERFFRTPPENWKFPAKLWSKIGLVIRIGVDILLCWLFWKLIAQYRPLLLELIKYHYLPLGAFILCVVSIPAFPVLRAWYGGERNRTGGYPNLGILSVCFTIPVYYLSLVTFSASLFAYLPASRGGGDYMVAPQVIVKLKPEFRPDPTTKTFLQPDLSGLSPGLQKSKPRTVPKNAEVLSYGFVTVRCILIEETTAALFIAVPTDAGGPVAWRQSPANRPMILAIDRNSIVAVEYFPP